LDGSEKDKQFQFYFPKKKRFPKLFLVFFSIKFFAEKVPSLSKAYLGTQNDSG